MEFKKKCYCSTTAVVQKSVLAQNNDSLLFVISGYETELDVEVLDLKQARRTRFVVVFSPKNLSTYPHSTYGSITCEIPLPRKKILVSGHFL